MASILSAPPSPSLSPVGQQQWRRSTHRLLLECALLLAYAPSVLSFHRNENCAQTTLAFHGHSHSRSSPPFKMHRSHHYRGSPRVHASDAISLSKGSDMSSNAEELGSLRRMRRLSLASSLPDPDPLLSAPRPGDSRVEETAKPVTRKRRLPPSDVNAPKLSIKSILRKPVGELTASNLNSLCNSIRHHRKGMSFRNLRILERILLELDDQSQHDASTMATRTTLLKPMHVFPLLTALSNDARAWKRKQSRTKHVRQKSPKENIKEDIQRLVQVVTLLRKHRHSDSLHPGCYSNDVQSFATMIAAETSRWEPSAVDASLFFLGMVEKEDGNTDWDPRLIGAVLDALAWSGRAEDAQALLGRALGVDISDSGPNNEAVVAAHSPSSTIKRLMPSQAGPCYNALLRAWSKKALLLAQGGPENSLNTHRGMKQIEQARHIILNHMPFQPEVTITNRTCTAVLGGYASLGRGVESEEMLVELEALHLSPLYSSSPLESSSSKSALDAACYNTVLHAYSQSQESDSVLRAERLFLAMKEGTPLKRSVEKSSVFIIPPKPDLISFSSTVNCFCRHGMVAKAEALLNELPSSFVPNAAMYLPVIEALGKSDNADAPNRALEWIERSNYSLPRPNRLLYTAALRCMRRHGRGKEAELVLEKFHDAYPNRGGPDVYSYLLVLRAWEKTKNKAALHAASKRAKIFINKMEEMAKESLLPKLDVNVYNILLNCYARGGEAENAENLVADLEGGLPSPLDGASIDGVRPNSNSYSLLIKALANSDLDDAVDRAWHVLYSLGYPQLLNDGKTIRDLVSFNVSMCNLHSMLKLFAKRGMAKEAEALLNSIDELIVEGTINGGGPDIQCYEAVLQALGRCGDADVPARAEALVTRLEVSSEMGGDCPPTLLCYNALLNCYANAGMAGKAERLLERLASKGTLNCDADVFSYAAAIKSLANSGKSEVVAVSRAESLSRRALSLLEPGTSNAIIFTHRLKLLAKFGKADEAELLLQQMEEQHLKPDVIHYTAVMNAWAKSVEKKSEDRAETLFKKMEESSCVDLDRAAYHSLLLNYSARGNYKKARHVLQRIIGSQNIEPNRNSFTMVIDAFARSQPKNAGEIAEELLDQMRGLHAAGNHEVEPDSITYASIIRCKNVKVDEMTKFEKIKLMRELQIEVWPFGPNV